MTEQTIDKQKLLDHIDQEITIVSQQEEVVMTAIMRYHWKGTLEALKAIRLDVASGRFNTPVMEHEQAYWAREGLIQKLQTEAQRMREALELIRRNELFEHMHKTSTWRLADEALSTTEPITDPITQAIRDFMPTVEQKAGYDALVAWLESTTAFTELEEPQ